MAYRIVSLYSGSGGNSLLIAAGGANILIDAGKSARTLCRTLCAVGSDIREIDAVFVTHEHTDHIGALETLSKKYRIPVHMTRASAACIPPRCRTFLDELLTTHPPHYSVSIGGLVITSFPARMTAPAASVTGLNLRTAAPGARLPDRCRLSPAILSADCRAARR